QASGDRRRPQAARRGLSPRPPLEANDWCRSASDSGEDGPGGAAWKASEVVQMSDNVNLVVVGVDGSRDSMSALAWAEKYAKATNATLRVVTTWAFPVAYGVPMYIEGYEPDVEAAAIIDKAVAEL